MEPEEKSHGALMGAIIITIILIIGGVYLLQQSTKGREATTQSTETTNLQQSQNQMALDANGTSTTTVETEIESMEFESLDSEI